MKFELLLRTAMRSIRSQGVLATGAHALDRLRHRATPDAFDLEYGTDTSGIQPLWTLSIRSPNAVFGTRYEPTTKTELVAALSSLDASSFLRRMPAPAGAAHIAMWRDQPGSSP